MSVFAMMRRPGTRWIVLVAGVGAAAVLSASLIESEAPTPISLDRPASARASGGRPDVTVTAPARTPAETTTTSTMPPRALPAILAPSASGALNGSVIVVDPGHNGRNFEYVDVRRPGVADGEEGPLCNTAGAATNSGVREVDLNWKIGSRLVELLRALGAAVVVTHADNSGFGPCADERGQLAQTADADLLVSIHADGAPPSASGFHMIHPSPHPKLRAESVQRSAIFARMLRDEFVVIGGRPATYVGDNGVQARGDLATLNNADRPSVLVELANLRNALDAQMITDPRSHELMARALARASFRMLAAASVPVPGPISADLDGDGLVDLLAGAPSWMLPTTTTTTTTITTTTLAPVQPADSPTVPSSPDATSSTVPQAGSVTPEG